MVVAFAVVVVGSFLLGWRWNRVIFQPLRHKPVLIGGQHRAAHHLEMSVAGCSGMRCWSSPRSVAVLSRAELYLSAHRVRRSARHPGRTGGGIRAFRFTRSSAWRARWW